VNSSLSHSTLFAYDPLNRLSTAVATGNSTYNLTFSYTADGSSGGGRFGNMTCTVNGSTNGLCPQYGFNQSTNQINNSGFTYDADGNLTSGGTHSYQYDAEGHVVSVDNGSTEASSYNALGQWVEQLLPGIDQDEYFYDPSGTMLGLYTAAAGHWWSQYIRLGQRIIAYYWADPNTRFLHADALGSTLQVVLQNGSVWTDLAQYPWGQEWQALGTNNWDEDFAGYDHTDQFADDQYPTPFRRYDPDHGRWLTPDPLGGDLTNPQSLNRYAYALNNPETLTDPSGLFPGGQPICMFRSRDNMSGCGAGYCETMGCGGEGGGQEVNVIPIVNCDSEGNCTTTWQSDGLPFGGTISVTSTDFGPKPGPNDIDINLPGEDAFNLSTSGCSAPAGSSGLGHYASGVASAISMFSEFLTGLGPGNQTFGPASVESQMMSTSPGVSTAVNKYLTIGQTSGLYTFGLSGLWDAGADPVQQFVGS
jgi:RHS repeat-associated protein